MIRRRAIAAAAATLLLALPTAASPADASPAGAVPVPVALAQEASAVSPGSSPDRAPDTVPAQEAAGRMPPAGSVAAGPGPDGAELDQLTAEVAAQLRCPVCRNQSVLESSATLSQEMQREIRRRLAAGDSPEQVKRYFVSRYGEWILLQPRAEGINLLVYVLPALALLAGLFVAWRQIRTWAGADGGEAGEAPAPTTGPADGAAGEAGGRPPAGSVSGEDGELSRQEEERVDALVREG